jgi:hypothetical protein
MDGWMDGITRLTDLVLLSLQIKADKGVRLFEAVVREREKRKWGRSMRH